MENKKIKIITHDGVFHADDVFAVSTFILSEEKKGNKDFEVIRTRDEKLINEGDVVIDVGRIYDPKKKRFDHHQPEGAGIRENGIPYASFGIVWKEYGGDLCESEGIAMDIDRTLVSAVDAEDNSSSIYINRIEGVDPMSLDDLMRYFHPTWLEDPRGYDDNFLDMITFAKKVIQRAIDKEKAERLAEEYVEEQYQKSEDKRIVVLDKSCPWKKALIRKPEPLFIIFPYLNIPDRWAVQVMPKEIGSYENRALFPESWAGLVDDELEQISGIKGAKFCHKARFLAIAKDKESAIEMAKLALIKLQ